MTDDVAPSPAPEPAAAAAPVAGYRRPGTGRVGIRELARALDLSVSTVSRALNGYADVSAATRARVERGARELGYAPKAFARRLASGQPQAVALVLPASPDSFGDPFFLTLMSGLGEVLSAAGLDMVVSCVPSGPAETQHYDDLIRRGAVDGAVLCRMRRDDARVRLLHQAGLPFVCLGSTDADRPAARIDFDLETGFRRLAGRLLAAGHTRIAFIEPPAGLRTGEDRKRGVLGAFADHHLAPDERLFVAGGFDTASGYRKTRELMSRSDPPTAIMAANDLCALGVLQALSDDGLRAGDDVAVTGCDDIALARYTSPALTTLALPVAEAARRLGAMLLTRMRGLPEVPPDPLVMPVEPVWRVSHLCSAL